MSSRIAVAFAVCIGAGLLAATGAQARPDVVGFHGEYSPGTIVVKTNERRLYLVVDQDHAVRYPVGVGKAGKQWAGVTQIDGEPVGHGALRGKPGPVYARLYEAYQAAKRRDSI